MAPVIERLASIQPFGIGEGPHWDPKEQLLYLVDLTTGTLACWSPKTNTTVYQKIGAHVSFIIPVEGAVNEFVVGSKLDILLIKWDVKANKILKKEVLATLKEGPDNRTNDAKCDVTGRLWFGTWDGKGQNPEGSFYSFTPKEGLVKHESQIFISNGHGFSSDNRKMYYIDTIKNRVDQYNVNSKTGTRELEKTVIDFKQAGVPGLPDGMTVDADGKLWIACVMGSRVIQVDPESGKVLQTIEFPNCTQITSATFGGPNLDELYVTSADIRDLKGFEDSYGAKEAGSTYKVTGHGARGLKPYEFVL